MTTSVDDGAIVWRDSLAGVDPPDLEGFFEGWPDPPTPSTHLEILRNSHEIVLAVEIPGGEVVGFVNAISDGVLSAYLPLLEVKPPWRGEGLGHELVRCMVHTLDDLYMVDAVCAPNLETFYGALGFQSLKGMAHRNYACQSGSPSTD